MRVLQVSTYDNLGGAAKIARSLFEGYKKRGIESYLACGVKKGNDPNIFKINNNGFRWHVLRGVEKKLGLERFHYPGALKIGSLTSLPPDVIHLHNLHGGYFDLRKLPAISIQYPTVLTLHDNWLLTGHCAYFIDCERWKIGCGQCPDLSRYPALDRDGTAINWFRKKNIYTHSKLYIVTPSKWLLDQVEESMLMPCVIKSRVIHNGVDLSVFKPANKSMIRRQLGIPEDAFVLLYVVASQRGSYKDYETIERALGILQGLSTKNQKIVFLGLGTGNETEITENFVKRLVPYEEDINEVVKYYQAADVYVHAAKADTFPTVILEALACGLPVVATDVGGISEQIVDGKTGYLVPSKASKLMADNIVNLIGDEKKRMQMTFQAANDAKSRFSVKLMIDKYLDFYSEMLQAQIVRNN